jgi:hypothetical protein
VCVLSRKPSEGLHPAYGVVVLGLRFAPVLDALQSALRDHGLLRLRLRSSQLFYAWWGRGEFLLEGFYGELDDLSGASQSLWDGRTKNRGQ